MTVSPVTVSPGAAVRRARTRAVARSRGQLCRAGDAGRLPGARRLALPCGSAKTQPGAWFRGSRAGRTWLGGGGGPAARTPHHTPGPLSGEAALPCACRSQDSGCHRDPPAAFPHPRVPRLRGLPGLPALGSFRQKPRSSLNCVSCEQRGISASGQARPVPRPLPRKQLCLPGSPQREPSKGLKGLLGPVTPVMTRRPSPRPPAAPLTCDRSPAHG